MVTEEWTLDLVMSFAVLKIRVVEWCLFLDVASHGTERSYNALRLDGSLSKGENIEVKVFFS